MGNRVFREISIAFRIGMGYSTYMRNKGNEAQTKGTETMETRIKELTDRGMSLEQATRKVAREANMEADKATRDASIAKSLEKLNASVKAGGNAKAIKIAAKLAAEEAKRS